MVLSVYINIQECINYIFMFSELYKSSHHKLYPILFPHSTVSYNDGNILLKWAQQEEPGYNSTNSTYTKSDVVLSGEPVLIDQHSSLPQFELLDTRTEEYSRPRTGLGELSPLLSLSTYLSIYLYQSLTLSLSF